MARFLLCRFVKKGAGADGEAGTDGLIVQPLGDARRNSITCFGCLSQGSPFLAQQAGVMSA